MQDFRPSPPLVLGLVGGVAAGKSTVAAAFGSAGLVVLDADAAAREAVEDPQILAQIENRFGSEILTADRKLDREALAALVFRDPEGRRRLEEVTHPAIRQRLVAALEAALAAGSSVVLDVPLLIEGGLVERCDHVVFVDVPEEERERRARTRGWEAGERERREAAQLSLDQKCNRSTATIRNSGSVANTETQVARFLADLAASS